MKTKECKTCSGRTSVKRTFCRVCWQFLDEDWKRKVSSSQVCQTQEHFDVIEMAAAIIENERLFTNRISSIANREAG